MNVEDALSKLKKTLEDIDPAVGRVYATLMSKYEAQDIIADYEFEDPDSESKCLKAFIIHPDDGEEHRQTTGREGYSESMQTFVITGFISMDPNNDARSISLEKAFIKIRAALRAVGRMAATGDAFHVGTMRWSGFVTAKVAKHNVIVKELILTVQDRETR